VRLYGVFEEVQSSTGGIDLPTYSVVSRVYPNPVMRRGTLTLEINRPVSGLLVQLYNVRGKLVRSELKRLDSDRRFTSWDVGEEAAGIYFMKIVAGSYETTHKVQVLR